MHHITRIDETDSFLNKLFIQVSSFQGLHNITKYLLQYIYIIIIYDLRSCILVPAKGEREKTKKKDFQLQTRFSEPKSNCVNKKHQYISETKHFLTKLGRFQIIMLKPTCLELRRMDGRSESATSPSLTMFWRSGGRDSVSIPARKLSALDFI